MARFATQDDDRWPASRLRMTTAARFATQDDDQGCGRCNSKSQFAIHDTDVAIANRNDVSRPRRDDNSRNRRNA